MAARLLWVPEIMVNLMRPGHIHVSGRRAGPHAERAHRPCQRAAIRGRAGPAVAPGAAGASWNRRPRRGHSRPAFRDHVRPRCPGRRLDDLRGDSGGHRGVLTPSQSLNCNFTVGCLAHDPPSPDRSCRETGGGASVMARRSRGRRLQNPCPSAPSQVHQQVPGQVLGSAVTRSSRHARSRGHMSGAEVVIFLGQTALWPIRMAH